MRGLFSLLMFGVAVVVAYLFVHQWRSVTPWGVGTGNIGGQSRDLPARDKRSLGQKIASPIKDITSNPLRYENKKVTLTGRVRGATRYASNRNMYLLTEDADNKILVIDDKEPPQEAWPRTVSGVVKVIGPPIGGLQYAYLVDVKQGVKVDPPKWDEIKHFFTDKYSDVKQGVNETRGK